jgi:hypothetical protein
MAGNGQISGELSIGDVISRTFDILRRDFAKFFVIFLVVEVIVGTLSALASVTSTVPLSGLGGGGTTSLTTYSNLPLFVLYLIASIVLGAISTIAAIKLASEDIRSGQVDVETGVRFAISKLPYILILEIIIGLVVAAALVALVILTLVLGLLAGILGVLVGIVLILLAALILAIALSLAVPALLIEGRGVIDSLSRSYALVSERWLKTFVLFLVLGLVILVADAVGGLIALPFGGARAIVSAIISALYAPILPIGLTVFYYSNAARLAPPPPPAPSPFTLGSKFCPNCGAEHSPSSLFCPKCGAKLST